MTTRTATLLAAATLLSLATPALAHEHGGRPDRPVTEAADAAEQAAAEADAQVAMARSGNRAGYQRLGYSPQQRDAWLAECRANHAPRERRQGGLIGGLLGAVVGGVAGNRIADGSRLGGTLIGAGVGGLAGAAIGTAIDRADERRDARRQDAALDYCEDYLGRYESGAYAQPGYGYGYGAGAVPVMMVPVAMAPQHIHDANCQEIEEWDEVVAPVRYVRPHTRLRVRAHTPAPRRGKLLPIK